MAIKFSICPVSAIERLLLTLWAGSLWVTGLIVAPVLFAMLDDRSLAGTLAGRLFTITAYIGMACGSVLCWIALLRKRRSNWRLLVLMVMLLLVGIGEFGLSFWIAGMREAGLVESAQFAWLHGAASLLFMVTAVLALLLVLAGQPAGSGQSRDSR